jgi:hypothetical protein
VYYFDSFQHNNSTQVAALWFIHPPVNIISLIENETPLIFKVLHTFNRVFNTKLTGGFRRNIQFDLHKNVFLLSLGKIAAKKTLDNNFANIV